MINPPVVHEHDWVVTKPLRPETDRCRICGMYRFDIMGPFSQRAARLRAYEDMETRLNRR